MLSRSFLLTIMCVLPALGQTAAPPATAADAVGPSFEVATVRPANRDDGRQWYGAKLAPSGRLTISSMSLNSLVWFAYVSEPGKPGAGVVRGGPKWADSDTFDINAKVDDAQMADWEQLSDRERMNRVGPMLRPLLADRFQLKLHTETRVTPVYALVQAKGGAKLKEVDPPPAHADPQDEQNRAGSSKSPDKPPAGGFMVSDKGWTAHAVQARGLLGQIAHETGDTDRVMVDETGLNGYYDFLIKFSHDKDGPTIEQQIEDQLGLKVESRKMPLKTYVIDSAEKPSDN